jgi:nitrate reductase NapD
MAMRWLSRRDFLKFGPTAGESDEPLVHIASLLIQATPTGLDAVRAAIGSMPGAELHETGHSGKVAVVLESADSRAIADATTELQQLSGVLTVSIVAHLMESPSALEQQHDDESTTVPPT